MLTYVNISLILRIGILVRIIINTWKMVEDVSFTHLII